ncbi:hypothetical protein [Halorubrum sp. 2020YC2]|uniref:hypothetical protein n=1 Tax=Halorubrum sp. 2020YC2 TaxID=2836432 RepID=UPI001BEA0567|nr:hypothetical protein [Halorubrum sp. 2020YC2]QWC20471.1 hypothetical protein KI388_05885 [Halorubrum sp. 2020YC2]
MRSALVRALRGICSAVSLLAFVALFLAVEARVTSPAVLLGLAAVGAVSLLAASGRSGIRRLLGRDGDGTATGGDPPAEGDAWLDESVEDTPWTDRADRARDEAETDWPLARLEPALDDAWNRWSDAALTLGLAALGVGSFALLATHPGDDPPLGLVLLLLFGLNGALVTLPFLFKED